VEDLNEECIDALEATDLATPRLPSRDSLNMLLNDGREDILRNDSMEKTELRFFAGAQCDSTDDGTGSTRSDRSDWNSGATPIRAGLVLIENASPSTAPPTNVSSISDSMELWPEEGVKDEEYRVLADSMLAGSSVELARMSLDVPSCSAVSTGWV
jgi:hypothetical protein